MNNNTVIYLLLGQALANLTIFFIVMEYNVRCAKEEGYHQCFIDVMTALDKAKVNIMRERREMLDKIKKEKGGSK